MVVTIFRSRLRPEHAEEYAVWSERTRSLAGGMPGFVAIKTFVADDGERVSIVEFEDRASHDAWRRHPEHREAMRLGRERFFSTYDIQVLEGDVRRSFEAPAD